MKFAILALFSVVGAVKLRQMNADAQVSHVAQIHQALAQAKAFQSEEFDMEAMIRGLDADQDGQLTLQEVIDGVMGPIDEMVAEFSSMMSPEELAEFAVEREQAVADITAEFKE